MFETKKIYFKRFWVLLLIFNLHFLSDFNPIHAQDIPTNEAQVRAELDKRGLTLEETVEALIAEGIDPSTLEDPSNASIEEIERIEQIIDDLAKKKAAESENSAPISSEIDNIPSEQEGIEVDTIPVEETTIDPNDSNEDLVEAPIAFPIYGQEIFRNSNVKLFKQEDAVKAPDSYILGPGDEISVSIFGNSQVEDKHEIRSDGYIRMLQGKRRVLLAGSTLGTAKEKLLSIYKSNYRFSDSQFQVTLSYQRTISVNIYGNVFKSGTYKLNAYNSAFNALIAVKGPNDDGTLRKINLIKNSGQVKVLDVYELLDNPGKMDDYFLEDNDIIQVPGQENIVTIIGGVTRPMKYELLDNEGLVELLQFAGGLKENAYRKTFRLERYEEDKKVVRDIEYSALSKRNSNFKLLDGDVITVDLITTSAENYVQIKGEVVNPGFFERYEGMRISDLLSDAVLTKRSKRDYAILIRSNPDSTKTYKRFDIDAILGQKKGEADLLLQDQDEVTVWPQGRFEDEMTIEVQGAVRFPEIFPFGVDQSITLHDAIQLAGGLSRDAGLKAIIHRKDPLRLSYGEYISIHNIQEVMQNPNSNENLVLQGFDEIQIVSENAYNEDAFITVDGDVNFPDEFAYGKNMTVVDALILARGFKLSASTSNIEVSRIVIKDNTPTKTIIANIEVNRDFDEIGNNDEANMKLLPYDQVIVRSVPEFEFQKNITIEGEVVYPGTYPILQNNEKISSVIQRAGGITEEGFAAGAKLIRTQDSLGHIVMKLDEVLKNKRSIYNYLLKEGDIIQIPKQKDWVIVEGATRVDEVLNDTQYGPNKSRAVPYVPGKNAKYYIDNYAGGISEEGRRNLIFVEHPNGEIEQTKRRFPFGFKYPDVRRGSTISVGIPPPEPILTEEEKDEIDWTKVLGDSVAQAMSILTLILLIQRLD